MNGPIFGTMNGPDFRSAVYLILALAELKVEGRGVQKRVKKKRSLFKTKLKNYTSKDSLSELVCSLR